MPYIAQDARSYARYCPHTSGELSYAMTCQLMDYIHGRGLSFAAISDVLGALEATKLEFYRRIVVPYEEGKRVTHGDVYGDH